MENLRCFHQDCIYMPIYICNCRFPPIFMCESHPRSHQEEPGHHVINKIPMRHNLELEGTTINLDDDLYSSQSYFILPGLNTINYCKLEISNIIELPEDYKNAFLSMATKLIKEILSIRRGKTKKIKKK